MEEHGSNGHDDGSSEQEWAGESLMGTQFDLAEARDEEGSRRERTDGETCGHLPQQRGLRNAGRRQAKALNRSGKDGQHTEVERVGVEQQAERHRYEAEQDGDMRAESCGDVGY